MLIQTPGVAEWFRWGFYGGEASAWRETGFTRDCKRRWAAVVVRSGRGVEICAQFAARVLVRRSGRRDRSNTK